MDTRVLVEEFLFAFERTKRQIRIFVGVVSTFRGDRNAGKVKVILALEKGATASGAHLPILLQLDANAAVELLNSLQLFDDEFEVPSRSVFSVQIGGISEAFRMDDEFGRRFWFEDPLSTFFDRRK